MICGWVAGCAFIAAVAERLASCDLRLAHAESLVFCCFFGIFCLRQELTDA